MSSVLLCLDGSTLAEQAIPHALAQLRRPGDELVLLRVIEPLAVDVDAHLAVRLELSAQTDAQRYLEGVATRLRDEGHPVRTELRTGPAAYEIGQATRELECDLVVLASHGRTGAARWLLGSVAENVGRFSRIPVWLVRCADEGTRAPGADVVLLALDRTERDEAAIAFARDWLRARPSRLVLVTASNLELPDAYLPDGADSRQGYLTHLQAYVAGQVARLKDLGWHVEGRVEDGFASQSLVEVAGKLGVDLIIMATHGRSGAERWVVGSVAERVFRHSPCPVVLVPSRQTVLAG